MSDDRITLQSILVPERTFRSLEASSKKKAIEVAAISLAELDTELDVGEVYRGLIDREKLGSAAIGEGVAIPHCRLASCSRIIGALFVFTDAVDFSAFDDIPVSIMFVLLVPESETTEHLKTLSMLAERCQNEAYRRSLMETRSSAELFEQAIAPLPAPPASSTG